MFRQGKQETEETIDQFYARFRHLASNCDFTNLEEEIKTQLVEKKCVDQNPKDVHHKYGMGELVNQSKMRRQHVLGNHDNQHIRKKKKLVSSNSDSSDEEVFSLSNSRREKQHPVAKLRLEKVKIDFLVDTGATVNILTAGDYQRICDVSKKRIPLQKTKTRIFAYGSPEPVPLQGKLTAMVKLKHRVAAATFYVTKDTQVLLFLVMTRPLVYV